MSSTVKLLRAYLRAVRTASGARAATLFAPAPDGVADNGMLIHQGDEPAIPELSDLSSAASLGIETPHVVPSSRNGGWLIRVDGSDAIHGVTPAGDGPETGRRDHDRRKSARDHRHAPIWIGIRVNPASSGADWRPDGPEGGSRSWESLLRVGVLLGGHVHHVSGILDDRLTGLPNRPEFQSRTDAALARIRVTGRSLAVMMVNPDNFGSINEVFGPRRGDDVIREVSEALVRSTRGEDFVARYGGAVFLVLLEGIEDPAETRPTERVLQAVSSSVTLDESFQLSLSAGIARVDPRDSPELRGADLIRRAEQALKMAKCAGGGCTREWNPAYDQESTGSLDGMGGVFTGNPVKDYRNMRLLSLIVGAIATGGDLDKLATSIVQRVGATFRADRVVLVDWSGENGRQQVFGGELDAEISDLLERVRATARSVVWDGAPGSLPRYAIPLVAGDMSLGCLYVDGDDPRVRLDASDIDFLNALAVQIAMALDRTRLTQIERAARDAERDRLRAELDQVRQASRKSHLVARSPQMKQLLEQARRVALTDATVLIHGESGTGKELLSHTLHELGARSDRPLVVVDCAAIPSTLIESELFGHERGAFTGAQQKKLGRLAEADGGTVFLDEIGELPLEVQGKLLRFVQEKQLSRVGSNQFREVDVRVLAATNRDLAREAREGRFREDLFHRLNVISLEVPPLRDRPEDVQVLIDQFLQQFSVQYHSGRPRRLSAEAETALLRYRWPGNVRELRNAIMRAVILSRDAVIGPELFEFGDDPARAPRSGSAFATHTGDPGEHADPDPNPRDSETVWALVDGALARTVDTILQRRVRDLPPLGAWLAEDLVLEAHRSAGGIATRAADILAIPEATFRRKFKKASTHVDQGSVHRPEAWAAVAPLLRELVAPAIAADRDVLRRARDVLLSIVRWRVGDRRSDGAALMGVSPPTYRRWSKGVPAEPPGMVSPTGVVESGGTG